MGLLLGGGLGMLSVLLVFLLLPTSRLLRAVVAGSSKGIIQTISLDVDDASMWGRLDSFQHVNVMPC
jgi:hypothetical protein